MGWLDFFGLQEQRLSGRWNKSGATRNEKMGLDYKIELQSGYLLMTCEGHFEPSLIGEFTDRVIEACKNYQPSQFLVDYRHVEGEMSTLDRYNLGVIAAKKYLDEKLAGKISNCRFAFVGNHPLVDPKKFGETVAVNRGLNVKVFTEIKEALAWLGVVPPGE